MKEHPILFAPDMAGAIRDGRKTMTRRVVIPQPEREPEGVWEVWKCRGKNGPDTYGACGVGPGASGDDHTGLWAFSKGMVSIGEPRHCPYGVPGDRLRMLTTWAVHRQYDALKPTQLPEDMDFVWTAFNLGGKPDVFGKLRPGRFCTLPLRQRWMPLADILDVGVERVADISAEDALNEGVVIEYNSGSNPQRPENWGEWSEKQQDEYVEKQARPTYMARLDDCERCVAEFRKLWDSISAKRGYGFDVNPFVWAVSFKRTKP